MRKVFSVLCMILVIIIAAGCGAGNTKNEGAVHNDIEINPLQKAANKDKTTVTLYFGCSYADKLVGEAREINV